MAHLPPTSFIPFPAALGLAPRREQSELIRELIQGVLKHVAVSPTRTGPYPACAPQGRFVFAVESGS